MNGEFGLYWVEDAVATCDLCHGDADVADFCLCKIQTDEGVDCLYKKGVISIQQLNFWKECTREGGMIEMLNEVDIGLWKQKEPNHLVANVSKDCSGDILCTELDGCQGKVTHKGTSTIVVEGVGLHACIEEVSAWIRDYASSEYNYKSLYGEFMVSFILQTDLENHLDVAMKDLSVSKFRMQPI